MRLSRILRFVGYGLLALATLEVAPRVEDYFRYRAPLFAPYSINTVFRASPFGKEGKPDARYLKWNMNSLGYRGPEPVAGRVNILTFGASETFGLYESPDHEYPRQLQSALDAARPGIYDVINIAIPGIRIGRTGYLDRALEQTGARIVVIYPSPANYIGTVEPFCGQADTPAPVHLALTDYSRLYGRVEQLVKRYTPSVLMTAARRRAIAREANGAAVMERVPQASIDAFRIDLECAIRAVRAHRAEPVVVTHATFFGDHADPEDEDMLVAWRRFYPELAESGFLDLERRANAAALEAAAATGARVVRADAAIPRGRANFADFVHFTDAGAARMAALLVPAILGDTSEHRP
jgi:lysophospholipase L1-like esterase